MPGLRVLAEEGAELLGIGMAGLGVGDPGPGELQEVLRRADHEDDERHRDDVGLAPIRQVELDGHPAAGDRVGIRGVGIAAGVREADRRLDRVPLEVRGARELRCLRGGGEGAPADGPLGVDGAVAGIRPAVGGVERVHDLLPQGCGRHEAETSYTRGPATMTRVILIYDPDCGFCRWCLGKVLAWDRRRAVRPVALGTEEANRLLGDMPGDEQRSSWHLVDESGEVHSAGAGFEPLLRLLPGGGPFAAAARPVRRRDRARLPVRLGQPQHLGQVRHRRRRSAARTDADRRASEASPRPRPGAGRGT